MFDKDKMLTIDKVLEIIDFQFRDIINSDINFKSKVKVKIINEQYYMPEEEKYEPNIIYIIVKFLESTTNYGVNLISFNLNIITESNKMRLTQDMLIKYANYYNFEEGKDETGIMYTQTYTTPVNTSAFEELYTGYRSTFVMVGTMVISYNMNDFDVYWYDDNDQKNELNTITNNINYIVSLDSQPYAESRDGFENYIESEHQYATIVLNFTSYITKGDFYKKIFKLIDSNLKKDNEFKFEIEFKDDDKTKIKKRTYKMSNANASKTMGKIPMISLTFTT